MLAQNSREMLVDHDWIVPKVGGEPWLERPPVPDWLICAVYAVAGTSASDSVARLAAVLVAVPIVLLVASTAALFYGRDAGLIAGGVFATMHELYGYASNPEADIFLCLIVTAAVAAFARAGVWPARRREPAKAVRSRPPTVAGARLLRAHGRDESREGRDLRHRDGRAAGRRLPAVEPLVGADQAATCGCGAGWPAPRWRSRGRWR